MSETRSYPRHVKTDAGDIEFRMMARIGTCFAHVDLLPSQESSFGHSRLIALAPATRLT